MKPETLVLFPSPGMGHLVTMVELGKLLHLNHGLSITILIATPPFSLGDAGPYIKSVESAGLDITFIHLLPTGDLPSYRDGRSATGHHELLIFEFLYACIPAVQQAMETIAKSTKIAAFIMDFFCIPSTSVAASLGVPTFIYFTSCAGVLAAFLHLPVLDRQSELSFRQLNSDLDIPGNPPFSSLDMPLPMLDRDQTYDWFITISKGAGRVDGIIVNTFDWLEPWPLRALCEGRCGSNSPAPPIYTIGPVIAFQHPRDRDALCLDWLQTQPEKSVVFLCFGSLGKFSLAQLKEIADGLERSGQRFLWVVRNPPEGSGRILMKPDRDPKELLPDGFLERTKARGFVMGCWAPQAKVLSHPTVGGFMTHCGWNSVLESVSAGVPMAAWPLYAEQRLNRVFLIDQMGLAVSVKEDKEGFVCAAEVERCVRLLVDSEEGAQLRQRAELAKQAAASALEQDGSSWMNQMRLVRAWKLSGEGPAMRNSETDRRLSGDANPARLTTTTKGTNENAFIDS